ncbi:MAG: anhydro-N-acetylmuramic acid kinase [Bacteroidota bacterium]
MSQYKVIGVMSGTSLDGIDLAYIHFEKKERWKFEILVAETIPYEASLEQQLREAIRYDDNILKHFDEFYTYSLATTIQKFIKKHQISELDAVCSHGHTILHQPEKGVTYQVGNLPVIAEILEQTVVCDFRVQDVELGGQGAPLVPIGDELLFPEYDYCLNLGGFANVSFHQNGKRIAYDICPVNIVLNKYAKQLGFDYDDRGHLARSGKYVSQVALQLNQLRYYKLKPPKSLGLEWVQQEIFPIVDTLKREEIDLLRTFTEHAAKQLAANFTEKSKILVTGGGAYNDYLLELVSSEKELNLVKPSNKLIDYKEALIFGFLGVLRLRDEVNCLQSVTGASRDHVSGKIYKK